MQRDTTYCYYTYMHNFLLKGKNTEHTSSVQKKACQEYGNSLTQK